MRRRLFLALLLLGLAPSLWADTATYASRDFDRVVDDADTDIAIPKPTGLAAGDLMVFVGGCIDARSFTDPGSWTLVDNTSDGALRGEVFSKIADAGDAAATNFTFTVGTFSQGIGAIFRLTTATATGIVVTKRTAASATTHSNADITTTADNSLVIWAMYVSAATTSATIDRGSERLDSSGAADSIYAGTEAIATAGLQTGAVVTTVTTVGARMVSVAVSPTGGAAAPTPRLTLLGVGD